MNKKYMAAWVCAHLLITPQIHAWEMPKNITGKQITMIAAVSAALLTLIGIVYCAKHRNKQPVQPPVNDAQGQQAASRDADAKVIQDLQREVGTLTNTVQKILHDVQAQAKHAVHDNGGVTAMPMQAEVRDPRVDKLEGQVQELTQQQEKIEQDMQAESAFRQNQLEQPLKTLSDHEQILAAHNESIERQKALIGQWALHTSELTRKQGFLAKRDEIEQLKKEHKIQMSNITRAFKVILSKIEVKDDPELTRLASALNQEVEEQEPIKTAEKIERQEKEQKEQLQRLMEDAANLKNKQKKKAKNSSNWHNQ